MAAQQFAPSTYGQFSVHGMINHHLVQQVPAYKNQTYNKFQHIRTHLFESQGEKGSYSKGANTDFKV